MVNAPLIDINKRLAAVRAKIREVIAQIATEGTSAAAAADQSLRVDRIAEQYVLLAKLLKEREADDRRQGSG